MKEIVFLWGRVLIKLYAGRFNLTCFILSVVSIDRDPVNRCLRRETSIALTSRRSPLTASAAGDAGRFTGCETHWHYPGGALDRAIRTDAPACGQYVGQPPRNQAAIRDAVRLSRTRTGGFPLSNPIAFFPPIPSRTG